MTQHPSLKLKGAGKEHRSVLKRFERILKLQEEEKWEKGDPIFGLPKVKTTRLKIKKEKAAPTPEEVAAAEGAEGAVPGEAQAGATPATTDKTAKAEKGAKGQAGKSEAKPIQEKGKKSSEKKK